MEVDNEGLVDECTDTHSLHVGKVEGRFFALEVFAGVQFENVGVRDENASVLLFAPFINLRVCVCVCVYSSSKESTTCNTVCVITSPYISHIKKHEEEEEREGGKEGGREGGREGECRSYVVGRKVIQEDRGFTVLS